MPIVQTGFEINAHLISVPCMWNVYISPVSMTRKRFLLQRLSITLSNLHCRHPPPLLIPYLPSDTTHGTKKPAPADATIPFSRRCHGARLANYVRRFAPCGLRGCKNGPAPFPGRMSYKATKPGLVFVLYLSMFFYCVGVY